MPTRSAASPGWPPAADDWSNNARTAYQRRRKKLMQRRQKSLHASVACRRPVQVRLAARPARIRFDPSDGWQALAGPPSLGQELEAGRAAGCTATNTHRHCWLAATLPKNLAGQRPTNRSERPSHCCERCRRAKCIRCQPNSTKRESTTLSLVDRFGTVLDSGRKIAAALSPAAVYR